MRTLLLSALIALALTAPLAAIDSSLAYQGTLEDAGAPASGDYDLEFRLQDAAGTQIGNTLAFDNVVVTAGVFTVALDFGNGAFTGPDRFLVIAVRPGASVGTYTALAPRTKVTAAPYAQLAQDANFAASVANDSIGSAQIANGSVSSGDIADGSIGAADTNGAQVQARVTGTCAANSSISAIASNGTVTCEPDDSGAGGGDITAVNTPVGGGLSGGVSTGDANLTIAVDGVTGAMIANGTIGGGDVDPAQIQARVSATCAAGSSIRAIASNGFVTCETDDTGTAGAWALAGNAGTNSATNFLGTTDAAPLVLRVGNQQIARFERTATIPNVTLGSAENLILSGVEGGVISGGGADTVNRNFVSDRFGTVGGGAKNTAGNENGVFTDARYASVLGGFLNLAGGAFSSVGGGSSNLALGTYSVIGGGNLNCSGGDYSWSGGRKAQVRHGLGASVPCSLAATSGDANGDEGSFVWADGQDAVFSSSGPNQFLIRADGGIGINTNLIEFGVDDLVLAARAVTGDADSDLVWRTRAGKTGRIFLSENTGGFQWNAESLTGGNYVSFGNGARLTAGGTFTNASSRVLKEGFTTVDAAAILGKLIALPISTWTYKSSSEGLHLGPVAEDFKQTFGLAGDGKSISTVDADGVALAAIQGLNAKLDAQNAVLHAQVEALLARVASLEGSHSTHLSVRAP